MKITRLVAQQKNENRANVYIDDEFAFGLQIETIYKFSLHRGMELTKAQIEEIKKEDSYYSCYAYTLNIVEKAWKTAAQVRKKLEKKEYAPEIIERVIQRMLEIGLIPTDEQFAELYTEIESESNWKSRRAIANKLKLKGVDNDVIENHVSQLDDRDVILKVAEKRLRLYKNLPRNAARQKLTQYLIGRGFDYADVEWAVNETIGSDENIDYTPDDNDFDFEEVLRLANEKKDKLAGETLQSARRKVYQFLISRHIPPDLAKDVMQQMKFDNPPEAPKQPVVKEKPQKEYELTEVLELVRKKKQQYGDIHPLKAKQKLYQFLAGKGIGYDIIREAIDQLFSGSDDEDWGYDA